MQNYTQICSQKREQFRQQIRRRQIENIFAQRRRAILEQSRKQQWMSVPANQQLMKRSLWKDQLVSQLATLLPALQHKIYSSINSISNNGIANIEYVIALSSNILRDNISVEQTEYVYNYCMHGLKICNGNISPLVQVYYYETVMATCYCRLDQTKQAQIQQCILPRLLQLMLKQEVEMGRISEGTNKNWCRQQILGGVLSAFFYYYQPERDHNQILIYKVKRTKICIQGIITWWHKSQSKLQLYQKYLQIAQYLNKMLIHITQVSLSLSLLISMDSIQLLIQILIKQLQNKSQQMANIKTLGLKAIQNLLKDQQLQPQSKLGENFVRTMMYQLQATADSEEQVQIVRVLNIVASKQEMEKPQFLSDTDAQNIISIVKDIIGRNQQHTQTILLKQCLQLIRNILIIGFQQGNSEYSNTLASIGCLRMIDSLYAVVKNQEILQIINYIYHYSDLC